MLSTQANVLGQEGLTTRMSYERGSGYGDGRGRSYGGGGNRGFTEVLLLQNQLRQARNMKQILQQLADKVMGIARVQGFVIFVKNGKVKQNVKVKVE